MAVVQPASLGEVLRFVKSIFPDIDDLPHVKDVMPTIQRWVEGGQIFQVDGKSRLYSLGVKGNHLLSVRQRRLRDKTRLFLLGAARDARLEMSGEVPKRLAGASPAVTGSSGIQGARLISSAAAPRDGRAYWPRVFKQLQVGSDWHSPDIFLALYSYPSPDAIHRASDRPAQGNDLSITDIGIAVGVSPRLLTSFIHKPDGHYREFMIGKRGGGERLISSPRRFLKIIQYWILDYLLTPLPVHPNCHAYRRGASILTNARGHVGKRYVANVDIKDFFPSIRPEFIAQFLRELGFGAQLAAAVSRLVTLKGGLPQGAPTSPIISNLFLADLDAAMADACDTRNLTYSRYADDITISGDSRDALLDILRVLRGKLRTKELLLNEKKTRIASQSGQQKVTGVVVNMKAQPPRQLRRKVRAMFHNAEINPKRAMKRVAELRGYVNYFNSFPVLSESRDIRRYRAILAKVTK